MLSLVLALSSLLRSTNALTTKFQAAHKSNTTLFCNYPHFQMSVTPWQIYWILPNETVIQPWPKFPGDGKYKIGYPPAHNLTVMNLNHEDFGWYYCIILWDNYHYLADSVKVGLNVDGALYDELTEEYKNKVITGSVAAGSVFVILCAGCAIWHYRFRENKPEPAEETEEYDFDDAIKSFGDTVDKDETEIEEIYKDPEIKLQPGSTEELLLIRDRLSKAIEEADEHALEMVNKAYDPMEDEGVTNTVLKKLQQSDFFLSETTSDATAF